MIAAVTGNRRRRTFTGPTKPIDPVDRFTIGHGMVGFCLGLWGMPWWTTLTSTIAFELVENLILKPAFPRIFPVGQPDTFANAAVDSAAWMSGWGLARAMFRDHNERAPIWR